MKITKTQVLKSHFYRGQRVLGDSPSIAFSKAKFKIQSWGQAFGAREEREITEGEARIFFGGPANWPKCLGKLRVYQATHGIPFGHDYVAA